MRFISAFIVVTGLLVSQGNAADTTIIAVLGDSLTAGYGIALEDAFPAQLEQQLKTDGYNVKLFNDGVSGDTSAGGLSRVDSVLQQSPSMVIIELGGNDLLRGLPPADLNNTLNQIMQRFQQAHIPMFVIGLQAPLTLGTAYANAFNTIFPTLANTYNSGLYPNFFESIYAHPNLMQPDGVHPTKEGVTLVVKNIAPLIEKRLPK